MPVHTSWNLEGLLRSRRRRILPLSALVLVVSWLTSEQLSEILGSRWLEVPWWRIFAHQLLLWTLWALVGFPLVRFAGWMRRRWRGWFRFLVAQLPLSLGVAAGLAFVYEQSFAMVVVRLDGERVRRPSRARACGPDRARRAGGRCDRGDRRLRVHACTSSACASTSPCTGSCSGSAPG